MRDHTPPGFLGEWDVTIATPIGKLAVFITFEQTPIGVVGTAHGKGEVVMLRNVSAVPEAGAEHVTWTQSVTRPIRLNLDFDVVVSGDTLTGVSRAGRLPASPVTGRRAPPWASPPG